jgi:hypothetical protein
MRRSILPAFCIDPNDSPCNWSLPECKVNITQILSRIHIYVPGVIVNKNGVKLVCVRIGVCEHFANILHATGYIRVTPDVSGYYSNRNQSLILLIVLTHS